MGEGARGGLSLGPWVWCSPSSYWFLRCFGSGWLSAPPGWYDPHLMPTVDEFRAALRVLGDDEIINEWLLSPGALHVDDRDIQYIQAALASAFRCAVQDVWVGITGSAKLGFSITEKPRRDADKLLRYRSFSPYSDIDVAVISPPIFESIWGELSDHSHRAARFPWRAERLGDYLVCGWLRPDHFPSQPRLPRCDLWWDTFRQLSTEPRFNRRSVRGGLFHSQDQLRKYIARAVRECRLVEELQ